MGRDVKRKVCENYTGGYHENGRVRALKPPQVVSDGKADAKCCKRSKAEGKRRSETREGEGTSYMMRHWSLRRFLLFGTPLGYRLRMRDRR